MIFSSRAQKLESSPLYSFFRLVKEKEAQGQKIISLGVGEPYQDTPEAIKQAGIEAIQDNKTRYLVSTGTLELKRAIAARYAVEPERVAVSSGAKPLLSAAIWSLVDEGDLFFIPAPIYPPFAQVVATCGGKVVGIDTKTDGFKLTAHSLSEALKQHAEAPGRRHIIINSPNNPTGAVYDLAELKEIFKICEAHEINVISDECYSNFSPDPAFSLLQLTDKAIVINSFSKAYAMPGWRVGYAVCPKELAATIGRYLDNYVGCPCSISDAAAQAALKHEALPDYTKQRALMVAWLNKLGLEARIEGMGGIFSFPDFAPIMARLGIADSMALAAMILEKAGVAVTPGVAFGQDYDTHLRLSYCLEMDRLKTALEKLEAVLG